MPKKPSPGNKPIVVSLEVSDFDLLQLHSLNPARYPYFLQTVAQSAGQSSYDILFACPQLSLKLLADGRQNIETGFSDSTKKQDVANRYTSMVESDFLHSFENLWRAEGQDWLGHNELPFSGGWFLYLGYELSRQIEPRLQSSKPAVSGSTN